MEDWPEYENVTLPNSCEMDQITQNAAILSARIGIEVAPVTLFNIEVWHDSWRVRTLSPEGAAPLCSELSPCHP